MPDINVKQYNELVVRLEKLADGLKLHGAEGNFPAVLKEEEFRHGKQELEDKRQAYDHAISQARQAYDAYNDAYKAWKAKTANSSTMLYGFYGKKNQLLADFGLIPYKSTGTRGPRTQKEPASN